jgi:NhaA family Na+:H+ antiporter
VGYTYSHGYSLYLGILSLLGPSISNGLKMFVMTLSIIDDILAVLVIALFYADDLSNIAIIGSTTIVGILVVANQAGIRRGAVYLIFGFVLWLMVLGSGVHTSIAGVLLAATMPMNTNDRSKCLVTKTKKVLHPWVSFLILPLFAFANTGFDLEDVSLENIFHPLALGIILGLFVGKQLGIFGIIVILQKYNIIKLPRNTSWWQMYGVSVLCGVGFTMSLFIGVLAFESGGPNYDDIVKAAVFIGSLLSAFVGYCILHLNKSKYQQAS